MSRVRIQMPESYAFETFRTLRVSDLNYGNHLGLDHLLALIHDVRFEYMGLEVGIENTFITIVDAQVSLLGEGLHGDRLKFSMRFGNFKRSLCALYCKVENQTKDELLAHVKTHLVFRCMQTRKPCAIPRSFLDKFSF
jgi:acyl-CoA thioester hydrolase